MAIATATMLFTSAGAEDWPQFRGPNRDGGWQTGEESDLRAFPAEGTFPIRWRAEVGRGWASPVVADGRVYVADSRLDQFEAWEQLHCFDVITGELLWTYAYQAPYPEWAFHPEQGGGPSATPIVNSGNVFMLGSNGEVCALESNSGSVIWEKNLGQEFEIWAMGCRSSPLVEQNLLILFVGAKPGACVIALDKQTGEEVWRALEEPILNSSPIVIQRNDESRQLIVWTADSISALEPATGRLIWRKPMTTSNNDGVSTPVFHEMRLLVGGLMMEFREESPEPEILWPEKYRAAPRRIFSNTSTALLRDGYGYTAQMRGELLCFEIATGKEVWREESLTELKSGASIHLTTVKGGKEALLFTNEGNLIHAVLSRHGYREIGRAQVIEPTSPFGSNMMAWAPPAYANGHGFFRNDREVVCLRLLNAP